jgi:hypothetical protein
VEKEKEYASMVNSRLFFLVMPVIKTNRSKKTMERGEL